MKSNEQVTVLRLPTPFPVGDVNCYLLQTDDENILIDSGPDTEEAWETLVRGLKQAGIAPREVTKLILTHHHADHAGQAYRFNELGVPVYGHPRIRPYLEQEEAFLATGDEFLQRLAKSFGVPEEIRLLLPSYSSALKWLGRGRLDHELREGDAVTADGTYRVIELPGHASDQIGILGSSGILFAADHLLARVEPNPLLEQPQFEGDAQVKRPVLQYIESLKRLQGETVQIAYTGHGEPIRDVPTLIESRLLQRKARSTQMLKLIHPKISLFELAGIIYGKRLKKSFPLVMSEMKARLDYLVASGRIEVAKVDGVLRYTPLAEKGTADAIPE